MANAHRHNMMSLLTVILISGGLYAAIELSDVSRQGATDNQSVSVPVSEQTNLAKSEPQKEQPPTKDPTANTKDKTVTGQTVTATAAKDPGKIQAASQATAPAKPNATKVPEIFTPSEQISEDLSVSFPIDI